MSILILSSFDIEDFIICEIWGTEPDVTLAEATQAYGIKNNRISLIVLMFKPPVYKLDTKLKNHIRFNTTIYNVLIRSNKRFKGK
jgi:hypothetical protein